MENKKMYLIDVIDGKNRAVDIEDSLESFYQALHCGIIDIVTRKIGGKPYAIICDDEGLFSEFPIVSAIDNDDSCMFVGNILVSGPADEEGELTELTPQDVENIEAHLRTVLLPDAFGKFRIREILTDVKY